MQLHHKVLIGTHHKTGTLWMYNIFQKICEIFNLTFFEGTQQELPKDFTIFLQYHSHFNLDQLHMEYRGLHLIRDPRDVIVSGCFYHQKTKEWWAHIPRKEYGWMTYQQRLNNYRSLEPKLFFEMKHVGLSTIKDMSRWNYTNPAFIEVKYEDLILDENLILFSKIFTFLGFPRKVIPQILQVAYDNSVFSGNLKKSLHIRSGEAKQWQKYFTPRLKKRFSELFNDVLIKLGYETDDNWANN